MNRLASLRTNIRFISGAAHSLMVCRSSVTKH